MKTDIMGEVVKVCPTEKGGWDYRASQMTGCTSTHPYHCLRDSSGNLREICIEKTRIHEGNCPILTSSKRLEWENCSLFQGCPTSRYMSDELYAYPMCYKNVFNSGSIAQSTGSSTSGSMIGTETLPSQPDDGGSGGGAVVPVVVVLILIVVIVVLLVWMYRRNKWGFKDRVTSVENIETDEALLSSDIMEMRIEKLRILQKYLVHILKEEISVKDLKEMSIIHSKSLAEHFSEPLLEDLKNVNKRNDYSRLDMSLVFALLRNFCPKIKQPTKGWDYEPPDNEMTVSADIERIRQIWNKYCDNNCESKNIDNVFNMMKQKYGTVAVEEINKTSSDDREGSEDVKVKIQSIKLNPDCVVEHGIVITEGVKTALQLLTTKNVVICRGAIGCGKTHALRAIQKKYEEKEWKLRWMEETLLEEIYDEKTLVLCDNMFGSFGCNTFSSNKILYIEKFLKKISETPVANIKVVVGIHQHVLDEVKQNNPLKFLQNKNITVDLDHQSEAETLLIFKEQQKGGHCHEDPNCWFTNIDFASVNAKLSLSRGHIGSPFLSWMYCCHHELFSDDAFSKAPLKNLLTRFEKMKTDSSSLYYSLIYIMCVRKHSHGNELERFAGMIEATVSKYSIENYIRTTPGYFQVDNNTVALAHEVLTIALFKTVTKSAEDLLPVYNYCELDTILQLTRPADELQSDFAYGLEYPRKMPEPQLNPARYLHKILVKRCLVHSDGENSFSADHPLNNHGLFTEKYPRYSRTKYKK